MMMNQMLVNNFLIFFIFNLWHRVLLLKCGGFKPVFHFIFPWIHFFRNTPQLMLGKRKSSSSFPILCTTGTIISSSSTTYSEEGPTINLANLSVRRPCCLVFIGECRTDNLGMCGIWERKSSLVNGGCETFSKISSGW